MGFYDFQKEDLARTAIAQDAETSASNLGETNAKKEEERGKAANEGEGEEPKDRHILTYEDLKKHEKRCKAKPGNCPYTKVYNDVDDLTSPEPPISKEKGYDRLGVAMTNLYALAADMAKMDLQNGSSDAKDLVEIIEGGLNRIQEICKDKGVSVGMDEAKTKYILKPPKN